MGSTSVPRCRYGQDKRVIDAYVVVTPDHDTNDMYPRLYETVIVPLIRSWHVAANGGFE